MDPDGRMVVVGGGHAAGQLVDSLRREGHEGEILLLTEEAFLPYQRPPLSKQFLAGKLPEQRLLLRQPEYYDKQRIEVRTAGRVTAIDRQAKMLTLQTGDRLEYSGLALALGARVRRLLLESAEARGVHYLRGIDDVREIRAGLDDVAHVVIVGGGFIGLEAAAVLRELGKEVAVLEAQDRLMPRVVSPFLSDYHLRLHAAHGVGIHTGAQVSAIEARGGRVAAVHCADGSVFPAELVVVGIGILPNVELAQAAGLPCDDGILVDECARTADPAIVAAGDCTNHPNPILGRRLRLESVHNAMEQAKSAAASLCGKELPYVQVPWFWSDQFEAKLQMVGLSAGFEHHVIRGDPESGHFSLFYYRGGRLIAVDSMSAPKDHLQARKLLGAGITPAPAQAADPGFDLRSLL